MTIFLLELIFSVGHKTVKFLDPSTFHCDRHVGVCDSSHMGQAPLLQGTLGPLSDPKIKKIPCPSHVNAVLLDWDCGSYIYGVFLSSS